MHEDFERIISRLPDGVEKRCATIEGYEVLVNYQGWKVAVITYAERFGKENLYRLERHTETDEVFVLLKGQATLYVGIEGTAAEMEPHAIYNIKCGTWHAISVSTDALVLICENQDTGSENTEYIKWSPFS